MRTRLDPETLKAIEELFGGKVCYLCGKPAERCVGKGKQPLKYFCQNCFQNNHHPTRIKKVKHG